MLHRTIVIRTRANKIHHTTKSKKLLLKKQQLQPQ